MYPSQRRFLSVLHFAGDIGTAQTTTQYGLDTDVVDIADRRPLDASA
jgi:hypothetical protein